MYIGRCAVTVVVVNWNAGELLDRCLASLMAQKLIPNEVILVDNASADNSVARVREKYKSVRIIESQKNLGFAAANNLAIHSSSSDSKWIAFLNPDAFPDSSWLEALLSKAESYPEYSMFGSRLMAFGQEEVVDGVGDVYHLSGLVWRDRHGMKLRSEDGIVRDIFSPCAAAAMFSKDALLAIGGFDEDYFCYIEDVDLGFRMRLAGYRCLYVPDSVAYHMGSAITGKHSDFSVYHAHRNLVWTFFKNMPGVLFWMLLPLHLSLNLVSLARFWIRGQGKVICRAKMDAILGLPGMWKKRKLIQSKRVVSIFSIWRSIDGGINLFSHY